MKSGVFRSVGLFPLDGAGGLGSQVEEDAVDALDLGRDLLGDRRHELERQLHDAGLDELLRGDRADRNHVAVGARAVLDADRLHVRVDREELLRLPVELRLLHLVAEDEVRLPEDVELLLGELAYFLIQFLALILHK